MYIARKMTLSAKGGKRSPALKVAVISTALSIAIMILAVSIVAGFRQEIRSKITGFDAHITLFPSVQFEGDMTMLTYTPEFRKFLESQPYIRHASLLATAPVLLKTPDHFKGVYLRGVEPDYDFTFIRNNLTAGKIPDLGKYPDDLVISTSTAEKLGLAPGDSVNMFMVSDEIRARKMRVAALFDTHFKNYDQYFAYGSAEAVRQVTGLKEAQGSAIEILTDDFYKIPEHTGSLIRALDGAIESGQVRQSLQVTTALEKGANYFAWLDLLDTNVWVILTLMTIVAAFTLISGMLIIILEKVRFIGVMKALGATRGQVRRIFIILALRVSLIGLAIGNAVAIGLILLQRSTHFIPLDADAYYMDFVPMDLNWWHLLLINAAFLVIIYACLILPSQFASRVNPVRTLNRE